MIERIVARGAAGRIAAGRLRTMLARCALAVAATVMAAAAQAESAAIGGPVGAPPARLALAGSPAGELAHATLPTLRALPTVTRDDGDTAAAGGALAGRPGAAAGRRDDEPQGYALVLGGLGLIAFLAHRRWSR